MNGPQSLQSTEQPEFPRKFVAPDADFGDWSVAEPYYRELTERRIDSRAGLEAWLLDWSELDACFDEEGAAREVAMTCQTDDPLREQRHLHFVQNVKPQRLAWHHRLRQKFVDAAARFPLPARRYEVLERSARNAITLFREQNVPLLTQDDVLQQRYQKLTAAMTVQFDGREQTLDQMSRYLEEPDRGLRERAWRLAAERFARDRATLNELYVQMVELRHRIARNAGCADYRDYAFRAKERFDYTPDDCRRFHDAIEAVAVPAARALAERRMARLGLETLRPWDLDVDPDGRAPLRPFQTDAQLADACGRVFRAVDPDFGRIFDALAQRGMLDLGNRKGKAPGGYQEMFHERRMPFIFMNAVGTEDDVATLLHEGGHAFHSWACRNEPLLAYRRYPLEFAEVASMGMECLAHPFLHEVYGSDAWRARRRHLTDIVNFLPWMARVDAMQHFVYTHVEAGLDAWLDHWQSLTRRFAPWQDWSGLDQHDRYSWQRKLHFYVAPFYYVEYGIAQLGALQVWLRARRDRAQAVAMYRAALALGGARPLPELFETAGCTFDFSERTLRPLIDAAMEEIAREDSQD